NADERFPVRPGDALKVALAIAHELVINQKRSRYAGDASVIGVLGRYKPAEVAQEIGGNLSREVIHRIATEHWESRGKSLVLAGSLQAQTEEAQALQITANF